METIKHFQLEKNIQPPKIEIYPYKQMEVGDSFFVYGKTPMDLRYSIQHARNSLGILLTAKKVVDGTRVWRIESATIEKNFPKPDKNTGKKLSAMNLDDSILIEGHTSHTISRYIYYIKKSKNYRFKTKTVNKGVRVTRIE